MKFKASYITWQNQNGVAMLGFADHEFNTMQYLLLQRTLEPDLQDHALGHDQVHIQLNERSAYGTVEEAQLQKGGLVLRLDDATAATVSGGENIEITLDVPTAKIKDLDKQLGLLIGKERVGTWRNGW
jgi:hypothetical protein